MPPVISRFLTRVQDQLRTVTLAQRVLLGMVAIGLVMGGIFFVKWVSAPSYAPLFSNLAATDASAIVDELNAEGVPYQLADGGGTVMVPKDKVYATRLAVSGKGLPAGKDTGYALLDKQGITTSEFQQNVQYQRALEGELANTLQGMDGVRTAVVHVALPKQDVFADDTGKPTASVLLALAPGTNLNATQVQAVTHLVASSVEGLTPDAVTVADSTGNVLSAPGQDGFVAGAGDAQTQMQKEVQDQLAANAQQLLDQVMGPGKGVVRVNADLSFDQHDQTSEKYTYKKGVPPLSETNSREKYSGAGSATGGVLGTDPTTGTGTGTGTSPDSKYDKQSNTRNNAVDKTVENTKVAPGQIRRLTVSVLMDANTAGSVNLQQMKSLVGNAVGLDTKRGDSIAIEQMPFDKSAAKQAAADLAAAQAAESRAQMMSWAKQGGLVLAVLVFLLIVWLRSRKGKEHAEPTLTPEQSEELELLRRELRERQVLDALEDQHVDRVAQGEAERRARIRTEIADLIDRQPEDVTTMLRGWLVEEEGAR